MKLPVPDWLVYLGILAALILYANYDAPTITPVPEPPVPEPPALDPLLPLESPDDNWILVQIDAPNLALAQPSPSPVTATGSWHGTLSMAAMILASVSVHGCLFVSSAPKFSRMRVRRRMILDH